MSIFAKPHKRYEISILIGPCSEEEAIAALEVAHEAVASFPSANHLGPGSGLNEWDEENQQPGRPIGDTLG